ncbi:unnamed protein product [Sphagnum balticum]
MESSSWRAAGNQLLLVLCLVLCGLSSSAALGRTRMIQKIHKEGVGESWLSHKLEPYECNSLVNPSRNPVKVETYISPAIVFKPGDAKNKYFHIQAPKGHLGLRNFVAEIVDSHGVSVPLHEVYLHHWFLFEYAVPKNQSVEHTQTLLRSLTAKEGKKNNLGSHLIGHGLMKRRKTHELADIGDDQRFKLLNTFGKGAETRRTETRLPAPFALELAPPSQIPMGYESVWILNVHGLDTRGVVDRMGCTECRCDLYNATTDEEGDPLPEGYLGGFHCCTDGRKCAVKEGFNGPERALYLKSSWEYVDWDECVVPLDFFGIDITNKLHGFGGNLIEFTVEGCGDADPNSEACVDTQDTTVSAPIGGQVVYVVSHLHATVLDATLWGEDGRVICRTLPIYGHGTEAGDENGYVVGVVSCYPPAGSPQGWITQGEELHYQVKYSKVGGPHTGLMGIVGVKIAKDEAPLAI